jgi:hypothetical protein
VAQARAALKRAPSGTPRVRFGREGRRPRPQPHLGRAKVQVVDGVQVGVLLGRVGGIWVGGGGGSERRQWQCRRAAVCAGEQAPRPRPQPCRRRGGELAREGEKRATHHVPAEEALPHAKVGHGRGHAGDGRHAAAVQQAALGANKKGREMRGGKGLGTSGETRPKGHEAKRWGTGVDRALCSRSSVRRPLADPADTLPSPPPRRPPPGGAGSSRSRASHRKTTAGCRRRRRAG